MTAAGSPPGIAARLPRPRGPLSEQLVTQLRHDPAAVSPVIDGDALAAWSDTVRRVEARLSDDDLHLALYCAYELHYRGFTDVDPDWEWHPSLLAMRAAMEAAFLDALHDAVGPPVPAPAASVETKLQAILAGGRGPSLSSYAEHHASLDEMRELAVHRSAYQLKEADPHTWAIPRLAGAPKAALVHIQADEYGNGRTAAMHAELFRSTLRSLGLDDRYGAYLERIPGVTLATVNLVSLFGLHRRWRGALAGHLAIFEMASVVPMGRYAAAIRRLGLPEEAAVFFDVHVEADATHEIIASRQLAAALAAAEPDLAGDVLFGARALMAVEEHFARHLVDSWKAGRSSLRRPPSRAPRTRSTHPLPGAHERRRAAVVALPPAELEVAG